MDLESYRPVLICLEPSEELELLLKKPQGIRMQQLDASNGPACTVVYGQTISARSNSGKLQRVKVALTLNGAE